MNAGLIDAQQLAKVEKLVKATWDFRFAELELPQGEVIGRAVSIVLASPTLNLSKLDPFISALVLATAIEKKADKVKLRLKGNSYRAVFQRELPYWLQWRIKYYPFDRMSFVVTVTNSEFKLPQ